MTPRVLPAARRPKEPSFHLYRPPPVDEHAARGARLLEVGDHARARRRCRPRCEGAPARGRAARSLQGRLGWRLPRSDGRRRDDHGRRSCASMIAQVALELETESGETVGMALAGTHGSAAWTAESASYTPSDETITQANLSSFKATSKLIVSEELRTDEAVSLDAYLAFELGGRLGALEETAFTVGDGSGKPLGIVHASSPYTVVNAATGSSTAYKLADLVTVYKALPAAYRANATWLVNADDFASLAGLVDTAGGLVLPSLHLDPPSLFGRPVLVSADLPTPAASAKSLAFGDWKRAYCVRRVRRGPDSAGGTAQRLRPGRIQAARSGGWASAPQRCGADPRPQCHLVNADRARLPRRLFDFVACNLKERFVCSLVLGKPLLGEPRVTGQDFIYLQRCFFERVLVFGNDGHFRLGYEKPCDSILDLFFVTRHPSRREFVRCPQVSPVDLDADVLYLSGSLLFEPFLRTGVRQAATDKGTSDSTEDTQCSGEDCEPAGIFHSPGRSSSSLMGSSSPSLRLVNRPRCRHRSTAPLVGRARGRWMPAGV